MATLKQEFIFFNDALGNILPGTKIFAYEAGSTTPKATYMDVTLLSSNAFPVVSDGAGRFGPIFLATGGYRIIVKDKDNVLIHDRDNINVAETTILSTSDFYFSNLVDAKLGVSINGSPVTLIIGQVARTVGKVTATDGLGAEWIVVAGGTGTADDDLFADLDNGLQLQKLFNQLYTGRNLGEIATAGPAAQLEAITNLGLRPTIAGFVASNTYYIDDDGDSQGGNIKDLTAGTTASVFRSFGPTGSGADVIWTALDAISADAIFVDILVDIESRSTVVGDVVASGIGYFRRTGATSARDDTTSVVTRVDTDSNAGGVLASSGSSLVRVPIDSNRRFDFTFNLSGLDVVTAIAYLKGFGV